MEGTLRKSWFAAGRRKKTRGGRGIIPRHWDELESFAATETKRPQFTPRVTTSNWEEHNSLQDRANLRRPVWPASEIAVREPHACEGQSQQPLLGTLASYCQIHVLRFTPVTQLCTQWSHGVRKSPSPTAPSFLQSRCPQTPGPSEQLQGPCHQPGSRHQPEHSPGHVGVTPTDSLPEHPALCSPSWAQAHRKAPTTEANS